MAKKPPSGRSRSSSHRHPDERELQVPESDTDSDEQVIDLNATAATQRDDDALRRDNAARERDQAARRRDEDAAKRDEHARSLETPGEGDALAGTNSIRIDARADRSKADEDRRLAEEDRSQAAIDRTQVTGEREEARIDELTGVLLRGPGFVELEHEAARARRSGVPLIVAFLDVVGLKAINNSLGHAAGDRALQEVARVVQNHLRPYDPLFRYGGDEFVCALAGASLVDTAQRLTGINAILAESPEHVSITIGFSELQADEKIEETVARADEDLYRQRQHRPTSH